MANKPTHRKLDENNVVSILEDLFLEIEEETQMQITPEKLYYNRKISKKMPKITLL